jgi:putative transposase
MKDSLWSLDLFCTESILLRTHWVMVVMDQFTRRIVGFAVQTDVVDGVALCRMFNAAVATVPPPKRVSTDNDPLFSFHRWLANLRVLGVEEVKTVPYVPLSHPFVVRLIGTLRREYLDHVLFWNDIDLERNLCEFATYYNEERVHTALLGRTPTQAAGRTSPRPADLNRFAWAGHCRGLIQRPRAA